MSSSEATTKQFGKGERSVPASSARAKRWYPAEDTKAPRKARKTLHPSKYRATLQPGAVLILLAGRFRGKRVVLLKHLKEGALLVTGPFKINGVPLRRVNSRYVIATSTKVDISGLDESTLDKVGKAEYFSREKKSKKQKGEDAFIKQGEKPEKKQPTSERASDQKTIDKPLLSAIKNEEFLASYLRSSFSLRHGQKPHEMVF
ncbi:60S ribosomal protein L6 [Elasticomyces elasticus]|uniref:60S ribosomal protein L6 n=1 Tax=Exophiala sideris TaxID=1016849 RepID=A0A0D1W2I1_9EURO|nr:60S ribosomal protein L6 [Elasticomyces elasticus]KAK5040565.1 60S ribosomal protein L6 [Exophiala sideris]KAK5186539.1 60S ribosomal protein L6 [Eurotiomycetes sp. CCFEE 6388]KAK5043011.1 60S ribosomal protein L6 [Exophiala sideris]KAK5068943.1 60S ribosomal protein L6 [Exophiala sideris]